MKPYSLDLRQKIITVKLEENLSIRQLAERFKVSKNFIQKLLKQQKETGSIQPKKPGGGQKKKLTPEQEAFVKEIINNNNHVTLKEIGEQLYKKFQIKIGQTTIWKITKKFNYSWKKKTLYAAEKTSEKVQQKRFDFWQMIKAFLPENLIFIDEAGVNLAMTRLYGRSEKGERARGEKPQKRGKNVTIIQALSLNQIEESVNIYGAVNGLIFEAFIVSKLVPKLSKGKIVVMDNASIHLGKMVKKYIEKAGAQLVYLAPYSPDFSPIENLWSKIKAILKKLEPRTYPNLINAITDAMLQVTQNDIHNWFAHCCYCAS